MLFRPFVLIMLAALQEAKVKKDGDGVAPANFQIGPKLAIISDPDAFFQAILTEV